MLPKQSGGVLFHIFNWQDSLCWSGLSTSPKWRLLGMRLETNSHQLGRQLTQVKWLLGKTAPLFITEGELRRGLGVQSSQSHLSLITGPQPVLSGSCSFSLTILIIRARAKASARSAGLLPAAFTAFLCTHVLIWINTPFNSCPYLLFVVSRTVRKSQRTHTPWWLSTTATWGSNVLSSL